MAARTFNREEPLVLEFTRARPRHLATFNPLLKRRPLFKEIGTSVPAGAARELKCGDALGASASASIVVE